MVIEAILYTFQLMQQLVIVTVVDALISIVKQFTLEMIQ